ncbi:MAG: biotin/lipoyl-binding protein [Lachnospiraceae bacterium]|nr:biotin/lipoyl-binding protein [Lachnospiraceae bacterium]
MNHKTLSMTKKIIIALVAGVVILALLVGIVYIAVYTGRGRVLVIEASEADYGFDEEIATTIEGTISTGRTQEVTTEMGQEVDQILVKEGDKVTAGQELLRFKDTEAALELEQARITLQGYEVSLENAKKDLEELNNAQEIRRIVTVTEEEAEDGEAIVEADAPEKNKKKSEENEGVTEETPSGTEETVYRTEDGDEYTLLELSEEKRALTEEITSAETDIKEARLEIEKAQRNLDKCVVRADMDGYVTKVSTASDAALSDGVILRVSSMEGLYVNSALSEWMLDSYGVGDTVFITNWVTGGLFEATITFVSPYDSSYYSEMYNDYSGSQASYYPFTAVIEAENTGLKSGDSVEVSFSYDAASSSLDEIGETEDTMYLLKAFIVSENGRKFVYVRNEKDRLEKREVVVGKQTEETAEIKKGLSPEDYIAFPYGKNVKEGAPVREGSIDELYEE